MGGREGVRVGVCACACVCVCARARACVLVCVCDCERARVHACANVRKLERPNGAAGATTADKSQSLDV